jgi:hypothetical protein
LIDSLLVSAVRCLFLQLNDLLQKIVDEFKIFLKAFGEKETARPEEIFGYILRFSRDLAAAHKASR